MEILGWKRLHEEETWKVLEKTDDQMTCVQGSQLTFRNVEHNRHNQLKVATECTYHISSGQWALGTQVSQESYAPCKDCTIRRSQTQIEKMASVSLLASSDGVNPSEKVSASLRGTDIYSAESSPV